MIDRISIALRLTFSFPAYISCLIYYSFFNILGHTFFEQSMNVHLCQIPNTEDFFSMFNHYSFI
jgi:hypothetical protein